MMQCVFCSTDDHIAVTIKARDSTLLVGEKCFKTLMSKGISWDESTHSKDLHRWFSSPRKRNMRSQSWADEFPFEFPPRPKNAINGSIVPIVTKEHKVDEEELERKKENEIIKHVKKHKGRWLKQIKIKGGKIR